MDILEALLFSQWLLISSLSVLSDVEELICDGVVFANEYYEKHLLFGTLHEPINLVMHRKSNELFFSHKVQSGAAFHSTIRVCNVEHRNCTDIEAVTEGRAIGYDRARDRIYLGGTNGIYLYDRLTHSAHFFAEANISVWNIFVKEFFYYVQTESKRVFININVNFTGPFTMFPILEDYEIDNYYVSTYNAMYFSNSSGLYKAYTPTKPIFVLNNTMNVREISQNFYAKESAVFFAVADGIYVQDKVHRRMEKISAIHELYGLTFKNVPMPRKETGKYEIIFSDYEAIYELVKSKHRHTCLKLLQPKNKPYKVDLDLMVNYY